MRVLWFVIAVAGCAEEAPETLADGSVPAAEPPPVVLPTYDPSAVPHPDYPTPEKAGTAALFLMEEPNRGPTVSAESVPEREGLSWTVHSNCEVEPPALTCSPERIESDPGVTWHVGSRAGRPHLVERHWPDGRVAESWVWTWRAEGTLERASHRDPRGEVLSSRSFDGAGRRMRDRARSGGNNIDGCGMRDVRLDEQGALSSETCLSWSGEPMLDTSGVATRRYVNRTDGFASREEFMGLGGEPVTSHYGVAVVETERNAAGRRTRERYLDAAGAPVTSSQWGCAGYAFRYERGQLVGQDCLTVSGAPGPDPSGVISTIFRYEASGCMLESRYVDADGSPAVDRDGTHVVATERDVHCASTKMACLDRDGAAIACEAGGPSRFDYTYDERGYLVSTRHEGGSGVDPNYGVFELRYRTDDRGNRTRLSCWNRSGEAVDCGTTGFHATTAVFDDAGREVKRRFEDAAGRPTTNVDTAERSFTYDSFDHLVAFREARADGSSPPGFAERRTLYDQGHRTFGILLFHDDDKPAAFPGCFVGIDCGDSPWHAVRLVRAPNGRVSHAQFFDHDKQLIRTDDCSVTRCFR